MLDRLNVDLLPLIDLAVGNTWRMFERLVGDTIETPGERGRPVPVGRGDRNLRPGLETVLVCDDDEAVRRLVVDWSKRSASRVG